MCLEFGNKRNDSILDTIYCGRRIKVRLTNLASSKRQFKGVIYLQRVLELREWQIEHSFKIEEKCYKMVESGGQ